MTEKIYPAEMKELLDRAQKGDLSIVPELRKCLEDHPEIWQTIGDLGMHVEQAIIELVAGPTLLGQEANRMQLAELKAGLAEGGAPTALEKLLIDRIAISWLQVHHGDYLENIKLRQNQAPAGGYAKIHDRAHQRLLAAIKMLALVRKLLKPALSPYQVAMGMTTGRKTAPTRNRMNMPVGVGIEN